MSFKVKTKKPGDMIRSEDWNEAMEEIFRLENNKLNLEGGGITGPLSISNMGDQKNGSPLRLEIEKEKAFIFKGENRGLTIAESGTVGIGTTDPDEKLEVAGNLKVTGLIKNGTSTNGAWYDTPKDWGNETTSHEFQVLTTRTITLTHNSRLLFQVSGHTSVAANAGLHAYVQVDGSTHGSGIHHWNVGNWHQVSYGFLCSMDAGDHLIELVFRNGSASGTKVNFNGVAVSYAVVGSF